MRNRILLQVDKKKFQQIAAGTCNRIKTDRDVASYIIKNSIDNATVMTGYPKKVDQIDRRISAVVFDGDLDAWIVFPPVCSECRQFGTCTIQSTCDGVYYAKN